MSLITKKRTDENTIDLLSISSKINITTLLIFKLYDYLIKDTYLRGSIKEVYYPILYLAHEYGLLTCYLDKDHKSIYLLFDNKNTNITSNKVLTTSYYNDFIDRLIDSKYFKSIQNNLQEKLVVVNLAIPEEFLSDIDLISKSRYSEVSSKYKNYMDIKLTKNRDIPLLKSKSVVRDIIFFNLAVKIVDKDPKLVEMISDAFGVNSSEITSNSEYYKHFVPENEYWNEEYITKTTEKCGH